METALILLSVMGIWALAVLSPGPNFLISAQTAVSSSRRIAMFLVLGIAVGTAFWGITGFFGVTWLFNTAPWLFVTVKFIGGAYLVYLGVRLLRSHASSDQEALAETAKRLTPRAAVFRGLITNLTNPKAPAFVASLFLTTMPPDPPLWLGLVSVAIMTTLSFSWYAITAWMFSTGWMTERYKRSRRWLDKIAGSVFIAFGIGFASFTRS